MIGGYEQVLHPPRFVANHVLVDTASGQDLGWAADVPTLEKLARAMFDSPAAYEIREHTGGPYPQRQQ